jgi:hypothetical protein
MIENLLGQGFFFLPFFVGAWNAAWEKLGKLFLS